MKDWEKLRDVVDAVFEDTKSEREKMTKYLNHFRGKLWDDGELEPHKSKAVANMVFSIIEHIAPMITDSRPITQVIPRHPEFMTLAEAYNNALKYVWNVTDMQRKVYEAVLDALIMKKGIFKFFWNKTEIDIEVVDPRNFFIAPGYDDEWSAPWCGVRELKPLSWIREQFPDVKDIAPDETTFKDDEKAKAFKYGEAESFELDARFAYVYEVWLRDEKAMEDFKDEEGKKQKRQKFPYGKYHYFTKTKELGVIASSDEHGKPPYVCFDDYTNPHEFLGMGEIDQLGDLDKEFNRQLQNWFNYSAKFNDPNSWLDTSFYTDEERYQKDKDKGGQVFAFDSAGAGASVPPAQYENVPPPNSGMMGEITSLPSLMDAVSGRTDTSEGRVSKQQRQSASEIAMLMEASQTRTRQRVRNLEGGLKRGAYLIVGLMMQYYANPRTVYFKQDEEQVWMTVGNSKAQALRLTGPRDEIMTSALQMDPSEYRRNLEPDDAEAMENYERLLESLSGMEDYDPVYFEFDIEVQTNSTLPIDKQSLANLMIRLAQMEMVDRRAVLETLQIPGWEEIDKRMGETEGPQKASPQNPEDIKDYMNALSQTQGAR